MRAQATIEFLLDFVVVLAMVGILLATLQGIDRKAAAQRGIYGAASNGEGEARALDELSTSLTHGQMDATGYRIDGHRVRMWTGERWILVETMYGENYAQEPV